MNNICESRNNLASTLTLPKKLKQELRCDKERTSERVKREARARAGEEEESGGREAARGEEARGGAGEGEGEKEEA